MPVFTEHLRARRSLDAFTEQKWIEEMNSSNSVRCAGFTEIYPITYNKCHQEKKLINFLYIFSAENF